MSKALYGLILLSGFSVLLSFLVEVQSNDQSITGEEISREVAFSYKELVETLKASIDDGSYKSIRTPWAIELFRGDSLIFWNTTRHIDDFGWHSSTELGDGYAAAIARFEPAGLNYPDKYISSDILEGTIILSNDSDLTIPLTNMGNIKSVELLKVYSSRNAQYVRFWGLVGFVLGLLILLLYLARVQRIVTIAAIIAIWVTCAVLVPVEAWFSDLVLSSAFPISRWFELSLLDLFWISVAALAYAHLAARRQLIVRAAPWQMAVIGLLSTTSFLLFIKIANEVATVPTIQLEIDRIFKFDKYSIIVLLFLSVVTLAYLACNIYIFYDAKKGLGAKSRYLLPAYLLGVLSTGLWFQLINTGLPFLLLYLFIVAFFVMIDLFVDTQRKNITWVIWWIMIMSGFLSVTIFYIGLTKSTAKRNSFTKSFFSSPVTDHLALVKSLDSLIRGSDLINQFANPPYSGIKYDEADVLHYMGLLAQNSQLDLSSYHIDLYGFDAYENSIFNQNFAFKSQVEQLINESESYSSFVYYQPYKCQYFLKYEIVDTLELSTSTDLYIQVTPNAAIKTGFDGLNQDFNYTVYKNDQPIFSQWPENYRLDSRFLLSLYSNRQSLRGVEIHGQTYNDFTVISYRKVASLIKPVSLFSYLFTLFGLMLIVIALVNSRYRFMRYPLSLQFSDKSSLRTKIQLVVIILILFAFLLIGVLTAYYFNNVIQSTHLKSITEQTTSLINNVESVAQSGGDNMAVLSITRARLDELAAIHNKTLGLYNSTGNLMAESLDGAFGQRLPYQEWSNVADNMPSTDGRSNWINADMTKSVVPLYNDGLKPFGFLTIAYDHNVQRSRNILDFLSTILNVYVFLFLLAGAIAILIANSITRPLTVLGQKLKNIKLGRRNEPLQWEGTDEIGVLIQDYNNLIIDLERSANIIAMTERDTAWREMAKQVAHEIKNPLTPMKLSIQYLQRANQAEQISGDLVERVSSTLIEQIDNLSQIASEFSNFGTMPLANNEKLLLNEIVADIHELFRKREDMDITMVEPISDLFVFADKNHLIRIFNNILKNAIQAIPESRRGKIEIALERVGQKAVVSVRDNGIGISEDKKSKVFTPNFTTKSSGTGLGLAISANMLESCNGHIYFESQEDQGATFFVEIPLMRLDDYQDGVERVMLE